MLLLNTSPIYLKCGLLLQKSDTLINEISALQNVFQYINTSITIEYKSKLLLLFKINYYNISHFKQSKDYIFIKDKLNICNTYATVHNKDSTEIKLNTHKDSISILNSPRNKSIHVPFCYYCGYLTGKREMLVYELFHMKCIKIGHLNQLSIYGIDFICDNIQNAFFKLPNTSVHTLIRVGQGIESTCDKEYLSLKGNLYPFILANVLEGVSIYRVESPTVFNRLGGNTLGATTLWSLLTMTCNYENPDEAIEDALKGDNRLIDLSVGDIYGGNYSRFSLGSELIASSFGKVKYTKNVNDVNKKDISRSLVTLFASAVSQMTAFISVSGKIDKIILVGNPFESLVLMQMFQVCTAMFSKNRVHEMFSDYSQYLEIIGMCVELDKTQLVTFDIEDEYKGLI